MKPRKQQRPPRWTGELNKPIPWVGPLGASSAPRTGLLSALMDEREAASQRAAELKIARRALLKEQLRKVSLLAERYGIDLNSENALLLLLLRLAADTVPGFQVEYEPKRTDPRTKWTPAYYSQLLADVEGVKKSRGCIDSEACYILVSEEPYQQQYGSGEVSSKHSLKKAARTLNSRLVEARNHPQIYPKDSLKGETEAEGRSRLDFLIAGFSAPSDDFASTKKPREGPRKKKSPRK